MATSTQERMSAVLHEAQTLAGLGNERTKEQSIKMAELVAEGKALKDQLDNEKELRGLAEFAGKSTGMLPLTASDALTSGQMSVNSMDHAGSTKIGYEQHTEGNASSGYRFRRSFELQEAYGEGLTAVNPAVKSQEYRQGFYNFIRAKGNEARMKAGELKILQEGIDTSGGFAVPPDWLERVIAKEPTPTRIAARVTQLSTTRDKLTMPRINYTSNPADDSDSTRYTTGMRVTWTNEIPASSSASLVTDPIFGQTDIPIYTAMMTLLLTNDMVEDSGFPLVSYVTGLFGQTIDLLKDNMIINGTGQGQPSGILLNPGGTNQPAVVVTGQASTLGTSGATGTTGPNLIKLSLTLPEQYDNDAAYVFNKTSTGSTIAQLLDANGRLLWGAGLQDSGIMPNWKERMIAGYPCVLSQFMPNVGTSTYPVIFGDLSGYYLVNRVSFSIQVLREVYATVNQIALVGRVRFGGQVVEPWRMQVLQCHT